MTRHTSRGIMLSVRQDDGFGNLVLINFQSLIARIVAGWMDTHKQEH